MDVGTPNILVARLRGRLWHGTLPHKASPFLLFLPVESWLLQRASRTISERCVRCKNKESIYHPLTKRSAIQTEQLGRLIPFKNLAAPSRHSGLSSLSPNDPKSSLTRISTFCGRDITLMSPYSKVTSEFHSNRFLCCKLEQMSL